MLLSLLKYRLLPADTTEKEIKKGFFLLVVVFVLQTGSYKMDNYLKSTCSDIDIILNSSYIFYS
jgi:hypothetical protein